MTGLGFNFKGIVFGNTVIYFCGELNKKIDTTLYSKYVAGASSHFKIQRLR